MNKNFSYRIIHRNTLPFDAHFYELYHLWRKVWFQAYTEELSFYGRPTSNYFFEHDFYLCLLFQKKIIGLITLKDLRVDLLNDDDSFFDIFHSSDELKHLHPLRNDEKKRRILSCSNLTIDQNFRGIYFDFKLKDIFFYLVRHFLLDTPYDLILSQVRNERGVQYASYRSGAREIARNIPYSKFPGQKVDIVKWDKDSLGIVENKELDELSHNLHKQAFFNEFQQEKNYVFEKSVLSPY
jgi:hypothetical protein